MDVASSVMGPERVLPSSEDDLGEDERPVAAAAWSEGGGEEEEEEEGGVQVEVDGEEEEAANDSGSYYYQPLNQEPDGLNATGPEEDEQEGAGPEEGAVTHAEQLEQVQERIEVMGLHLPEAPPPDSDEEQDADGAAAVRSRASIPMDEDHVELVKRTMAAVALPSLGVPAWAMEISDDQWKDMVQNTLQSRQSSGSLHLNRKHNN
ncbi:male-enhanced antigen 1 [Genypterus blacodes]|uniref:male-enhanced antigen 1 n=1 Tax=Genypterus blacodes TaxID=154954 RepID=UPI003F76F88E